MGSIRAGRPTATDLLDDIEGTQASASGRDVGEWLWHLAISMRTGLVLIFGIAVCSFIGTMIAQAPAEIRGPFKPIKTNVPGMEISEIFPRMARHADKFSIVRSVYHTAAAVHDTGHQMMQTGRFFTGGLNTPHAGSVAAYLMGRKTDLPPFVVLPELMGSGGGNLPNGQAGGFLGIRLEGDDADIVAEHLPVPFHAAAGADIDHDDGPSGGRLHGGHDDRPLPVDPRGGPEVHEPRRAQPERRLRDARVGLGPRGRLSPGRQGRQCARAGGGDQCAHHLFLGEVVEHLAPRCLCVFNQITQHGPSDVMGHVADGLVFLVLHHCFGFVPCAYHHLAA